MTPNAPVFTTYQKFVIGSLAFLQFTLILDFMVISPLGAFLLRDLNINPHQFGLLVSSYAFSAGLSGIVAAGFADRFDRKKILVFFYVGFLLGTLFCGIAPSYHTLLAARIITGIFGGVIGSVVLAIVADLFPFQMRGRVMGVLQTAFAGSQVLGIPLGLYLANHWGWHMPFLLILGIGVVVGVFIFMGLKPIDGHLKTKVDRNPIHHFWLTLSDMRHLKAFAATGLLITGGFMLMPFSSAYTVHNLGVSLQQLPLVYLITGITALFAGPLLGKLSDRIGKFKVFCIGTAISMVMVLIFCNLGVTPLWAVILVNVLLFMGITGRIISSSALLSAVPKPENRGAFMSVNASIQQFAGGIASYIAGILVVQTASGRIEHYDWLGYVVACSMVGAALLMFRIHRLVV